jgi:hypothetical protein
MTPRDGTTAPKVCFSATVVEEQDIEAGLV